MSDEPSTPDPYEARYMEGGAALARAKKRIPGWFFALLAVAGLSGPIATIASRAPLLPTLPLTLVSLLVMTVVATLFSHLRVVATSTHLHVQLGLFGPKIAYGQITAVERGRAGVTGVRVAADAAPVAEAQEAEREGATRGEERRG